MLNVYYTTSPAQHFGFYLDIFFVKAFEISWMATLPLSGYVTHIYQQCVAASLYISEPYRT